MMLRRDGAPDPLQPVEGARPTARVVLLARAYSYLLFRFEQEAAKMAAESAAATGEASKDGDVETGRPEGEMEHTP